MRKMIAAAAAALLGLSSYAAKPAAFDIERIDPPHWWVGMANDTLQLMVQGRDAGLADVAIKPYAGVKLLETVRLESPNYLLLYLTVDKSAKPGNLELTFTHGKTKQERRYELRKRLKANEDYVGFDQSDVLYLVMPDRFARGAAGASDSEAVASLRHKDMPDRTDPNARHGGNIAGMREHLDYIDSLGVTAVWVNPVLENDMPGGAYHGYATTDYYRIDPRLGSNKEWNEFIADAHGRGIKVVMDMIFNHSGSEHPWFRDMPSKDWYNHSDEYVQTSYRLSTVYDPYATDYDKDLTVNGWFVPSMPDLNQRNPHVMRYLIQNSIWWIEESDINGIRMDTHPYADEKAMAGWINEVLRQYPNFNIVGECWYTNEGGEAYWQRNSRTNPHGDPALPVTMDFALMEMARRAFTEETTPWAGLNDIYDHLALDYLFANPNNQLTFLDNHDTDRFLLEEPDSLAQWKQAITFLLTSRGIPQLYYGTELLMAGSKEGSDGFVRRDMPGGFEGDTVNVFAEEGRTPMQREAFDFMQKLLRWRRGNEAIAKGALKHFMPTNGVYAYQRRLPDGRDVTVIMNGTDEELSTPWDRYLEVLEPGRERRDMLAGRKVTPAAGAMLTLAPREILILDY